MLLYAWDIPIPNQETSVSKVGKTDLYEFLARIFVSCIERMIKRGFGRDYIAQHEDTVLIRGKINFTDSMKRLTSYSSRMACSYDDMSHNMPMNQIIKATAHFLLSCRTLEKETIYRLDTAAKYLTQISDVTIQQSMFKVLRFHRNNTQYALPIYISEVLFSNSFPDEKTGQIRFKDFFRDENMAMLFERFVFRFFEKRQQLFRVRYQKVLRWDLDYVPDHKAIPDMRLDILLSSRDRNIVIDTKFYREAMKSSGFDSVKKLISNNLYQLHTYLIQGEKDPDIGPYAEGILIYPQVDQQFCYQFTTKGHQIKACSINLNQKWDCIETDLLKLISPMSALDS